jgi:hypothetical protein
MRNFVLLKKLIAILFLSIYAVSATELHELFKLPNLIEHFTEHQSEDNTTSLIDFLLAHYTSLDDGDGDKTKDMELPFKSNHNGFNISNTGLHSFNNIQLAIKTTPIESKIYNTYSTDFISSAYLSSIWQPPKSC